MYEVFIVDDEPLAIEGLKLLVDWEKYGFTIVGTYENGAEALHQICQNPPDLVITDIRMPVMDGLRLIEEARLAGNDSMLFVIASGYGDFEYAQRAMCLGVSNYLTKPLIEEEANEMLLRLSHDIQDRALRHTLNRHAQWQSEHRTLLAILLEQEEDMQREKSTFERLSQQAANWTYLKMVTEAKWMSAVQQAFRLTEPTVQFARMIEKDNHLLGIVIGGCESLSLEKEIYNFAQTLLRNMPPEAQPSIQLAIGCGVEQLESLRLSWHSAEEAAAFLFYSSANLISYQEVEFRQRSVSVHPASLTLVDRILTCIEQASEEELCVAIAEMFHTFEQGTVAPALVQDRIERIVVGAIALLKEWGGDVEALIRESSLCHDQASILTCAAALHHIQTFAVRCRKERVLLQEQHSGGVQGQVAHFLRLHYTESLTIQQLAERFYIHPTYLGQSFTRKYGVGIATFIHDLRIEEACRLLRERKLPSYKVAEQVGYKDYRHFLKQFAKRTGSKPAEYKEA